MARRKLTDEQVKQAHARCVAGEKLKDVAAELDMQPEAIRQRARTLGLPALKRGARRVLTERQVLEAHKRCVAGERLKGIAADYGVTPQAISNRCKLLGLSALPCTRPGDGVIDKPRRAEELLNAYRQWKAGRLQRQIAQDMGYAGTGPLSTTFKRWRDWLEANA